MAIINSLAILLIVPYGIETTTSDIGLADFARLLIVPYGIETGTWVGSRQSILTFNCTLWN